MNRKKHAIIIGVGLVIGCFIFILSMFISQQTNKEIESIVNDIKDGETNLIAISSAYRKYENSQKLENAFLKEVRSGISAEELASFVQTLSKNEYHKESIKTAFIEKADDILEENKTDIKKYLESISKFSQYNDNYYYVLGDIISEEELISYINNNCEKVIFKNECNGYYDSVTKKEDVSYTTSTYDSVKESHSYFGDFYIYEYHLRRYRPTGESWEEELLSGYDENQVDFYYKNQQLYLGEFSEKFPSYVAGAKAVYINNDVVIVQKNGKVFSSVGEILYTNTLSDEEMLENAINGFCVAGYNYYASGGEAEKYFDENFESFHLLTSEEIKTILPGNWVLYYSNVDSELNVTFYSNGKYTEHYESSNPSYDWMTEEGVLYKRKYTSSNDWQNKYKIRKITDDIYVLYNQKGNKAIMAMKKVG